MVLPMLKMNVSGSGAASSPLAGGALGNGGLIVSGGTTSVTPNGLLIWIGGERSCLLKGLNQSTIHMPLCWEELGNKCPENLKGA